MGKHTGANSQRYLLASVQLVHPFTINKDCNEICISRATRAPTGSTQSTPINNGTGVHDASVDESLVDTLCVHGVCKVLTWRKAP